MISRIDLRGDTLPEGGALRDLLPRAEFDVEAALEKVRPICEDVHHRGTAALIEYARTFDGVELAQVRVPAQALADALEQLDPAVRAALEESIRRARIVHRAQRRTEHTTQVVPGGTVTEKWIPVERVGLYAPGGRSVYPSSVVMNVVPAQEAGVESIALASPPQKEFGGLPHPTILAACALLGVDEVYAAGGAVAVAMFAYGTTGPDGCPPVNMVTGPGNIWVAAAKRYFTGRIGIDTEAGPTEIAVLADATADPVHVAADLISQAEHDPLAAAVLVTDSAELAAAVEKELEPQVAASKHVEDRIRPALAGRQSAIVLVDSLEDGLKVVDAYGAEHLEVQTADAAAWAARVRNAGAIFVGAWSPVSLGDYCAGSNHVLPTAGCACHSSGLSVQSFLRGVHIVDYTRDALAEVTHHVVALAEAEDLPAHGAALKARFGWKVPGQ
ncbi:histidinol dehydrogenase [Streptomyces subrutilus]|uniref:Histidinol dehydrogenase n=1 Tax=Streptomyces subrutilus TaxID=36818 RepID=A0A5P2UNW9_9ACTN|nr:histidinol dehydrogenase [Streptomyces subrutilus]QEU81016.1 histidinol dehydrogenase [Streptomyces subrutilus]WSJ29677.1 histidinol dehydrogenase [Streptomyces subrutilus]GGZ66342.1 histidinol dehydrogenase [Streptomyces subrutilus]